MPELATRDQAAIRDIPRSCTCWWEWVHRRNAEPDHGVYRRPARWVCFRPDPDCIWHATNASRGKAS